MVKYGEKGVKTMVEYGEIWRFVSWNDANFTPDPMVTMVYGLLTLR